MARRIAAVQAFVDRWLVHELAPRIRGKTVADSIELCQRYVDVRLQEEVRAGKVDGKGVLIQVFADREFQGGVAIKAKAAQ